MLSPRSSDRNQQVWFSVSGGIYVTGPYYYPFYEWPLTAALVCFREQGGGELTCNVMGIFIDSVREALLHAARYYHGYYYTTAVPKYLGMYVYSPPPPPKQPAAPPVPWFTPRSPPPYQIGRAVV